MAIKWFLYETYKIKLKGFFDIIINVYLIMSYQPTPFSLIMPSVPAHITDGDIAHLWGMNPYIRSIQMEPFVENSIRCQRVTINFDDFNGYGDELRKDIMKGYYKTNPYNFHERSGGRSGGRSGRNYLLESSYLLPCDRPQPPRTEYSHVVALQLQDVVKKQAEQMERLENRIKEMETTIREGTEIQLDIQQTYIATFERLESRLLEQDSYRIRLEANMISLQELHFEDMKQHIEEKEELKQKIEALIGWCSQPVWKRTPSFVLPKEPEDRFVSEF